MQRSGGAEERTYSSAFWGHLILFPVELSVLLLSLVDLEEVSVTLLYDSPQFLSLPHLCLLSLNLLLH